MVVPLFIIDAFTERPFAGNPAGVCLLERPADEAWMQALARELGFSETAFVTPAAAGEPLGLRWFTPTVEMELCGHATLASAHALAQCDRMDPVQPLRFATLSGVLEVRRQGGAYSLVLPAGEPSPAQVPTGLAEVLGAPVRRVAVGRRGAAMSDLVVELADEQAVTGLGPDLGSLAQLEHGAFLVTAAADGPDVDYVLRVFGPRVGIAEDPATGSAHCLLGPWWAERLGRSELVAVQRSSRGARFGVQVRPAGTHDPGGDGDGGGVVEVSGAAATVVRGTVEPVDAGSPRR